MGQIVDAILKKKQLDEISAHNLVEQAQGSVDTFMRARQSAALLDIERQKTQATIDSMVNESFSRTRKLDIEDRVANAQIADYTAKARQSAMMADVLQSALQAPAQSDASAGAPPVNRLIARGILSKEFGIPFEQMATPEERQQLLDQKTNEAQTMELAKGIPTSESGRVTLANESLKNIDDIITTLFPDGTASSFNREIALRSNLPGITMPITGKRLTPQVSPDNPVDPSDNEKAQAAQEVFRKMGTALSGRQLIQTGVAARPEETAKLVAQFAPHFTSNPKAALNGLNELKAFYKDYVDNVKTRGIKKGEGKKSEEKKGSSYEDYLKAVGH